MMRISLLQGCSSRLSATRGCNNRLDRLSRRSSIQHHGTRRHGDQQFALQGCRCNSTVVENNRRPQRMNPIKTRISHPYNSFRPSRSRETDEVLNTFFRKSNETKPKPFESTSSSEGPSSPSPSQERLKAEILNKFFAKRPVAESSKARHTAEASSSMQASKLSQIIRSNTESRSSPKAGPSGSLHPIRTMNRMNNDTFESISLRTLSKPAATSSATPLPRFSLARPQIQRHQEQIQSQQRHQQSPSKSRSDPTDVTALRLALFGDRKQRSRASSVPSSSSESEVPVHAASATTSTSTRNPNFDAPLSDFIRRIQLEQAQRAAEAAAVLKENPSAGAREAPLPRWRMTEGRLHFDLRSIRNNQRQPDDKSALSWGRPQASEQQRRKPVHVNPKDQVVQLPPYDVTVAEASLLLREKTSRVRRVLRHTLGLVIDDNFLIDRETMELVAMELDVKFERSSSNSTLPLDEELLLQRRAVAAAATNDLSQTHSHENVANYASLPPRPPVVCLLGHVDHGKTTLMDALRRRAKQLKTENSDNKNGKKKKTKGDKKTTESLNVAGTEAGGITQIISAFQVPLADDESSSDVATVPAVTFLDTPGHAAFKAMRQSGSDAADIIVLVVAADDGVSAQTVEILDFYKSIVKGAGIGGISLVVAMNKIDKPGIDVEESRRRIESQLLEHGIVVEGMPGADDGEYGPPVQLIPVSGLTGQGLDDLVDGLMLQAEVMDLRADHEASVEGIVMDARVDKGLGIAVDCIVRWGSISKGDVVVSGTSMGRVRILKDMSDKPCSKGLPSQPVRIVGFETLPSAGDAIISVESEDAANDLINRRKASLAAHPNNSSSSLNDAELQSAGKHMMHEEWKDALEAKYGLDSDGETTIRIPVIVKADADGTLAAIRDALIEIGKESRHNVVIDPVKIGVGPVLASEIQMAKEGNATIICFNVNNEQTTSRMAEDEGVSLIGNKVIYALLDQAREEFAKYLPSQTVEVVHGRAEVQATYEIGGLSDMVAGLRVMDGKLYRSKTETKVESRYRVLRNGQPISNSGLRATSLKHFKEDVDVIARGKDCGLSLAGFSDFQEGDVIECFSVEIKREFI